VTGVAGGPSVTRQGRVLRCVLSTAAHGASLDFAAVRETTAALRALDPAVGAVLLVGEGPNFCTGGDVKAFAAAAGRPSGAAAGRPSDAADDVGATVRSLAGVLHDLVRALAEAPVPVVAAVHGWAAGAGMSVVLAADVAVAGTSTRLRPAYPAIGLTPDGGMTWTLPRAVGAARARHILLTDRVLSADEALDLGLVAVVVPDDAVAAEAHRLAERLADGPVGALGLVKRLLLESPDRDLGTQLDAEAAAIARSAAGAEGREGVAAFVERRAPRFRG
jgi:2-(1,2-epoxy-1,2-dihydrophenyl)acetyl-CoA isomerase